MQSDQRLGDFPAPASLRTKPESARHLLRQSRCTLARVPVPEIDPQRANDADRIETRMLEKVLVFSREHRVHHHLRNLVETDNLPLGAGAVEQIGDQLRLQQKLIAL